MIRVTVYMDVHCTYVLYITNVRGGASCSGAIYAYQRVHYAYNPRVPVIMGRFICAPSFE